METLRNIMSEIGGIIEHPIVYVGQMPLTIMSIVLGIVILLVFVLISKGLRKLLKTRVFDKYELDEGIQLVVERTANAVKTFNRLCEEGADAAIAMHLTC